MNGSFTALCRYLSGPAILVCFLAAPLSYAAPAAPQGEAPLPPLEVTVTAPRLPTPQELAGDSVTNFVAAHARPSSASGHLARWQEPVCAETKGMTPGFNAFVSARIAAIAAIVGAPSGTKGCKPNVHIYFTPEPQTLVTSIAKEYPSLLGFHYVHQTESLATVRHPIEGWYATATRGAACGQLRSILDLLAPRCDRERPTAVTAGDLAFLRALYSTGNQEASYDMETTIIGGIVRSQLTPH
jgi:hypothetical protein